MIQNIDSLVMTFALNLQNPILNKFMLFITGMGSVPVMITVLIAVFLIMKNKNVALNVAFSAFIAAALGHLIKFIIHRPRPDGIRLAIEKGYSFPSAHAMMSTFIYGFIIYLIVKNHKDKKIAKFFAIGFGVLILLVSFSRIYIGVHYFTDVICGIILGLICLYSYIKYILEPDKINFNRIFKKTSNCEKM